MRASSGALAAVLAGCAREHGAVDDIDSLFLNYDESGLDDAYDQGEWADNISDVIARLDAWSERALQDLGEPERHMYGTTPIEGLDWYRSDGPSAPIHVHFYGGAWRGGESGSDGGLPRGRGDLRAVGRRRAARSS